MDKVGAPSLWKRITAHTGFADWLGDPARRFEQGIGVGWDFPNDKKLDIVPVGGATKEVTRDGDFQVGWVAVEL